MSDMRRAPTSLTMATLPPYEDPMTDATNSGSRMSQTSLPGSSRVVSTSIARATRDVLMVDVVQTMPVAPIINNSTPSTSNGASSRIVSPPPPSFVSLALYNQATSGPTPTWPNTHTQTPHAHHSSSLPIPNRHRRNSSDSSDSDLERGGHHHLHRASISEERPKEVRLLTTIARLPTLFGGGNGKGRQSHSEHASLLGAAAHPPVPTHTHTHTHTQGSTSVPNTNTNTLHPYHPNVTPSTTTTKITISEPLLPTTHKPAVDDGSNVVLAPNKTSKLKRTKTARIVKVGSWSCMILVGLVTAGLVAGVVLIIIRFAVTASGR
jgi:hypothetical protein